jgi:hypothetical protein
MINHSLQVGIEYRVSLKEAKALQQIMIMFLLRPKASKGEGLSLKRNLNPNQSLRLCLSQLLHKTLSKSTGMLLSKSLSLPLNKSISMPLNKFLSMPLSMPIRLSPNLYPKLDLNILLFRNQTFR